jgi:hypothetical protein
MKKSSRMDVIVFTKEPANNVVSFPIFHQFIRVSGSRKRIALYLAERSISRTKQSTLTISQSR